MVNPKPKKKAVPLNKLKAKLDIVFSQYIRLTHADEFGMVRCYTCSQSHHWTKIQNGHLFSRGRLGTRFDPDNCRPQCVGCNVMAHGNYQEYFPRMIDEVGADQVNWLRQLSLKPCKISRADYEWSIARYSVEVAELKLTKGAF